MTVKKKKTRATKSSVKARSAKTLKQKTSKTMQTRSTGRASVKNKLLPCKAKIFMTGYSQAVRLPKEFQLECDEVFITRDGDNLILSPKPTSWDYFFQNAPRVTDDFMETREDLPVQKRKLFD